MPPLPTIAAVLTAVTALHTTAASPSPAYLTHVTTHRRGGQDYKLTELQTCPRARASKHFQNCDEACTAVDKEPVDLGYPATTATGASTVETVQSMLATAWAGYPHRVDLWLRTGCHGARELKYLTASVELFWPRGIGSIVLVLDESDRPIVRHLVPNDTKHDYIVRFEHAPCMPSRIFNQVSYMFADHYSTADVLVTIDSDCVLFSPVTPDLLFRDGKIRLPHSRAFQAGMWEALVEFFMGPGSFKFHTMVSQPVTFHRSTFAAFRDWYKQAHNGACYVDDVVRSLDTVDPGLMGAFCWMCQLGTFLNTTRLTADLYDFVDLDRPTPVPYQRMSVHTTYELQEGLDFHATNVLAVKQGLCLSLGTTMLPECAGVDTAYVREHMFKYEKLDWTVSENVKAATVQAYVGELARLLAQARVGGGRKMMR